MIYTTYGISESVFQFAHAPAESFDAAVYTFAYPKEVVDMAVDTLSFVGAVVGLLHEDSGAYGDTSHPKSSARLVSV